MVAKWYFADLFIADWGTFVAKCWNQTWAKEEAELSGFTIVSAATLCLGVNGKLGSLCCGKKNTKKCPFYRLVGGCFRRNSDTIFIFFADWNILPLLFFSYAKAAERELHLATDSKLAWCSRNMAVAPCCASRSKHGTISPVSEAFPSSSSCKWAPACSSCFKGTWTQQLLQSSLLCSWQEKQVCRDRISHAACEVWTGIWPFAEDVWTSLGSGYEHSLFTLCR